MTKMMACGSCGKPALRFSKERWAPLCASTAPAASTGRAASGSAPWRDELDDTSGRLKRDRASDRGLASARSGVARYLLFLGDRPVASFECERRVVIERRMP